MANRKIVAIDIDDVLAKSAKGFVEFSNHEWGTSLTIEDYQEEWAKVWNVGLEEALRRSEVFHDSGVVGRYETDENALAVLKRMAKSYDLLAITSRRKILQPETESWIGKNYPHIFQAIHYAGIWDVELDRGSVRKTLAHTKADLCRQLHVDYLIDDQAKHCFGAAGEGIWAILFGDYSWNRDYSKLPGMVTRAADWGEVAEYFNV